MEKSLEQLKQEYEKTTVLLEQEKRKMQRLKNRQAYLESGSRKQRTHRLITRGAAIESIAPQTKELSEAEFYSLMESVLSVVQPAPYYPAVNRRSVFPGTAFQIRLPVFQTLHFPFFSVPAGQWFFHIPASTVPKIFPCSHILC